ncbi:MAG: hypothetical protein RJA94_3214 [Pseudomonadota bacterium]
MRLPFAFRHSDVRYQTPSGPPFRSHSQKVGLPGQNIGGFDLLPDQIDEDGNAFRGQGA